MHTASNAQGRDSRGLREPCLISTKAVIQMFYCGVDIGKYNHAVCIINEDGDTVLKLKAGNNAAGFSKLKAHLERLQLGPDMAEFCMEASGHYWLNLYCYLDQLGYRVGVINPIQSKALRNVYVRKTKTDPKDALLLADLLRLGRVPQTSLASETVIKLQTLSRARFEFVRQIGRLKNRILGTLDRIFPEYSDCFSDVFVRSSRELLKKYTAPEDLAEVDLSELAEFLSKHSRNRLGRERAEQIQALAKGTIGIHLAKDAFTLHLRLLLKQIEFIEEQITIIEEAIDQVMEELRPTPDTPYRHVIETIPGIGPVLAAAIIGELGDDVSKFKNAMSVVAYAGIDPSVNSSGEFEGTRNRISKRGSPLLRHSLWLAAVTARNYIPELKEYYEKKLREGKHYKVATCAVARRLTHIIYSICKNQRPFDPNHVWEAPRKKVNPDPYAVFKDRTTKKLLDFT
mgnify:FL=1